MSSSAFDLAEKEYQESQSKRTPSDLFLEAEKKFKATNQPKAARIAMQAGIGGIKGAALATPIGQALAAADILTPSAIADALKEEISSELGTPKSLREAYYGKGPFDKKEIPRQEKSPEINPQVASNAAFNLYDKLLGGEGYVGGAATAPVRAAGIDTNPQGPGEETVRFASEVASILQKGGMPVNQAIKYALASAATYAGGRQFGLEETPASILGGIGPFTIPKAAQYAAQGVSKATRKLFPGSQAAEGAALERSAVSSQGLPESPYETAEQILKEYSQRQPTAQTPSIIPQTEASASAPSLKGRVTKEGSRLRNVSPEMQQTLDPVGRIVSEERFKSDLAGGQTFREITRNEVAIEKDLAKEAYELAEAEYSDLVAPVPKLINEIQATKSKLNESGSLNPAQKIVDQELDNILKMISTPSGDAIAVPINRLIQTSNSIVQRMPEKDIFGDSRKILGKIGRDLNVASREAVQIAGRNPQAMIEADKRYANFAQKFNKDELVDFTAKENLDPKKSYESLINDNAKFRALQNAIGQTQQGKMAIRNLERDIVEEQLQPYIKDISKVGSREYEEKIKDLEGIIGKKRAKEIDQRLSESRTRHLERRFPKKKLEIKTTPLDKLYEKEAQLLKKSPEEIVKSFDSRTTIKQLKEASYKTPEGKRLYNQLHDQVLRDMLREKDVSKTSTGTQISNMLKSRRNREIITEMKGEKFLSDLEQAANEIGKKEFRHEATKKFGKKIVQHAVALEFVKLFFPFL
jgi:uncharacterized protein (UPF0297 family)